MTVSFKIDAAPEPFAIISENGELVEFDEALCRKAAKEFDGLRGYYKEEYQCWAKMITLILDAERAGKQKLEALLKERDGGAHDQDCKSQYGKHCNCGHDEVMEYFEGKK